MAKATSLIKAYLSESIPPNGGFIISAFFESGTAYAVYEVTSYSNVKDIFKTTDGIVFKTDGSRTHLLVEPPSFAKKHTEPVHREKGKSIPYRFNEMEIITCRKQEKVMVPQEPVNMYSSFTILEHKTESFAFVFHPSKDVYLAIKRFITDSLYNDCNLNKNNAEQAAESLLNTIKKFSVWKV